MSQSFPSMSESPAIEKSKAREPRYRTILRWAGVLLFWLSLVALSLAGGLSVGGLLGYVTAQPPIDELDQYNPPQVTQVYDRTGSEVIARFYEEKRELVPLAEMPRDLINAFLAIEDERFYEHFGADLKGIARAVYVDLKTRSLSQGASTITQQLVRNVLTEQVTRIRTFERKKRELLISLQIEQSFSKDQILEFYLNHIPLGHMSFGVQSAAGTYFGKDVRDLSIAECASLAAIPKGPSAYNPRSYPEKNQGRRNLVIAKMAELGMIDPATAEREMAKPLETASRASTVIRSSYFVDHLRRTLTRTSDFEENSLARGGFSIRSTGSMELQKILEEELAKGLREAEKLWQEAKPERVHDEEKDLWEKEGSTELRKGQHRLAKIVKVHDDGVTVEIQGYRAKAPFHRKTGKESRDEEPAYHLPYYDPDMVVKEGKLIDVVVESVDPRKRQVELSLMDDICLQGSAVLLDAQTGEILALVGGYDFNDQSNNGNYNRASQGGSQPGSVFKPLLYAAAVNDKLTAATVIMDDRVEYSVGKGQKPFVPRNYENAYYGPTALAEALTHSRNVVTVKLFRQLGMDKALEIYHKFNVTEPFSKWTLRRELSLCLGSLDTSPLSIGAAYVALARRGVAIEPKAYTTVTGPDDRVVGEMRPQERIVISPQAAYITTWMLNQVILHGTGYSAVGKVFDWAKTPEMAGKTGTTSDCVDAWFVGYTPELVLVVAVGFDESRTLGPKMTGGRVAAPIWRAMMERILATRSDWKMKFDVPAGIVFRDISARTGHLAGPDCPHGGEKIIKGAPFVQGTEPTEICHGYGGFDYWRYQHPDPKKNQIWDTSEYRTYESSGEAPSEAASSEGNEPGFSAVTSLTPVQPVEEGTHLTGESGVDSTDRDSGMRSETPSESGVLAPPWED